MTIQEVKDTLPDVKIRIGDDVYEGKVSGSQRTYAKVTAWVGDDEQPWPLSYDFSWKAVTRAANTGSILTP